jgi:hypothetical protein
MPFSIRTICRVPVCGPVTYHAGLLRAKVMSGVFQ